MADPSRKKDYSSQVRKKLITSSRTGQACDRCKPSNTYYGSLVCRIPENNVVAWLDGQGNRFRTGKRICALRKIRCDADPNGCYACRAASEVCETTDRITKKAQRRGLADHLEIENQYLKTQLQDCQRRLRELGVPVVDVQFTPTTGRSISLQPDGGESSDRRASFSSSTEDSIWQKHMNNVSGNLCPNPAFSMLRGTKLSLFGMHIDLAEFAQDPMDTDSPQTFGGFIYYSNASNAKDHANPPPLPPSLRQAQEYASWYFTFLGPYTPIIDKRQMHQLLLEVYNDPRPGPRPGRSAAQEVLVHIMFSYIKFQVGQRNQNTVMTDEATAHFKYAVGYIQDLLRGQTLLDVQATAMIALQLRAYPRPGASWIFGQMALNLAIECGMHRSMESLPASEKHAMDSGEVELRKRLFWSLYGVVCGLSMRLGRPLPLRLSDIDIELPAPVQDYLDGEEESLSDFQKCSFQVGIVICRLMALQSELYNAFYTLSTPPPGEYSRLVNKFRTDLDAWRTYIPSEISDSQQATSELVMYAMFLELYDAEFRFLLYHPLLHPPNQPESYKQIVNLCQEAISDSLKLFLRIKEAKSLDVPWHMTTLLLAMTFTQLFMEDQRSAEITEEEFQKLEEDMSTWLALFGTVGEILGSGQRLQASVGFIIQNVLDKLRASLGPKALPANTAKMMDATQHGHVSADNYAATRRIATPGMPVIATNVEAEYTPHSYNTADPAYSTDGTDAGYSRFESSGTRSVYPSQHLTYNSAANYAAAAKHIPGSYSNPGAVAYYATQPDGTATPANEWIRWGQANLTNMNQVVGNPMHQQEYVASANTLMSMGSRNPIVQGNNNEQEAGGQWPTNLFHLGQFGGSAPG